MLLYKKLLLMTFGTTYVYYHGLHLKCYGLVSTVSCIFWTICLPSLHVCIICTGCYVQ